MFENIYGLSCVENQVLALMRQAGYDISPLYHNGAVPLKALFEYLVVRGESPYHFTIMPRIQEELKKRGLVEMCLKRIPFPERVYEELRMGRAQEYILMRVTPEFTRRHLHARNMRTDHFVYTKICGENLLLQNDIPESIVSFPADRIAEIYDGEYIRLQLHGEKKIAVGQLWETRLYKAEEYIPFRFQKQDIEAVDDVAVRLGHAARIYKIMCCRMAAYYGAYVDTSFIQNAVPTIEQIYLQMEYYQLKKQVTVQRFFTLLSRLNDCESQLMTRLKDLLQPVRGGRDCRGSGRIDG